MSTFAYGFRVRATVLVLVLVPNVAAAQGSRFFVGGAGVVSSQGDGNETAAPDTPHPGVSGNVLGIAATIGVRIGSRVSLAVEISDPSRLEVQQGVDYGGTSALINNRHRDLIVSGAVHIHFAVDRSMSPEVVAGVSIVNEGTFRSYAAGLNPSYTVPPAYGPFGPETEMTRNTLGFVTGIDLPIRLASHVGFVPGFRLHFVQRESDYNAPSYELHLGPTVWRAALGLRVQF
jgi:hypothetical protein